ncbi:MAG: Stage V sporulation protein D [candidate division BRC1 bacterium ADurb.BinA364]|nr:MAG: Stage V sporulation protein D [candidate division BRC1 bacterium ADurb.BinA364]
MSLPSVAPRRETAREAPYFAQRLRVLGLIGLGLLFVLAARLAYLCIIHGDEYYRQSVENFLKTETIPAPRGIIADRFGRPLATNTISYSAYLTPYQNTSDTLTLSLLRFEEMTGIPVIDARKTHRDWPLPKDPEKPFSSSMKFTSFPLADRLPLEVAARIAERPPDELPGISVEETFRRVYPTRIATRRALSHVLGMIGRIESPAEIERLSQPRNEVVQPVEIDKDYIGKRGIELAYEDELRGIKGEQYQVRNVRGNPIGPPEVRRPARGGADLVLTIDVDLQTSASQIMDWGDPANPFNGAVVAMDPRNGEILALVSKPEFAYPPDPGYPQGFYSKAVNGGYPPGSTFKIVAATAALTAGIDPLHEYVCNKYWKFGRATYKCLSYHNNINMYGAIRSSCNVYFFELARQLGWSALAQTAHAYGFGEITDNDFQSQAAQQYQLSSSVPSIKIKAPPLTVDPNYVDGNVIQMAVGQGENVSVTPLQLCSVYSAIANKEGLLLRPHLVREVIRSGEDGERVRRVIDPGARWRTPASNRFIRDNLIRGLRMVIEERGGTGSRAGFDPAWKVAGKSGSAEWSVGASTTHAWFSCFAPYDDPEICVTVLCEKVEGHGGEVAAPIAAMVLDRYFNHTRPKLLEAEWRGEEPLRVSLQDLK